MRAIVWDGERLFVTDRMQLRAPGSGEVKVRVVVSGICHSDLNMMEGPSCNTPVVLGHEAAGIVEETGPGVTRFASGDAVMVGTQTSCGECRECRRGTPANCDITWGFASSHPFQLDGVPVHNFANVSSFAGEIVVKESQLYPTFELPPEQAALIGCAVSTGYCAARNLGQASAGDRVAVIGVGGIGVNAIQGARLAGADVLAVDLNPGKESVARSFGADRFLLSDRNWDADGMAQAMREAASPIDIAIECSGAPAAVEAAISAVKRGGRVILIGMTRPGASVTLPLDQLLGGREIVSIMNGGAQPERDYPHLIALAREKRIDIAAQITRIWPLAEFEEAIRALRAGEVTRAVLDHRI
jgi:S-(hydroxymethyl)glutathione dehydrogenase/alcohol dehydrogenase